MRLEVLVAAALTAALAVPARAQSLAEIAEATKKKRQEQKKPGASRVLTEADLRGGSKSGTYSPMGVEGGAQPEASPSPAAGRAPAGQPAAGATPAPKTEEEERAERLAEWRDRLAKAQADVSRFNDEITRYQTALNDISGPLYGGTRTGLQTRLDEARRNLAASQQAVNDITEEGRRNGWR